jgi:hypothetical protein
VYFFTINNIAAAGNSVLLKLRTKKINYGTVMQFQCLLKHERWVSVYKNSETKV